MSSNVRHFTHIVPAEALDTFETITELTDAILNVADAPEDDASWQLTWWTESSAQEDALSTALQNAAQQTGLGTLTINFAEPTDDWQNQQQQEFKPLTLEPFHITYDADAPTPQDLIGLYIPAAMAFGTGKHATTAGCLSLLHSHYEQNSSYNNVLDLGCGSGILAIAAAKLGFSAIVASDNDPESVKATQENATNNGVAADIVTLESDGFSHPAMSERGPYQLILANILANPLKELAPAIVDHLSPNGTVILSGFLGDQEDDVIADYQALGLKVDKNFAQDDWRAVRLVRI